MRSDTVEDEILRRLTPGDKLAVMHRLIRQAYELKAAWLRSEHPDWTDDEIHARACALVYGGERA